ncbi:DUF998 domain-containing protein [Cellulomonas fengjieae]|uniref:DUF998 domain-containing protein n=1 Tax=Cellulomonas fengjieae TaxID=2819978 RepID=UPI001AAEE5FE|nr:DUF998 domain-containing protein [Cellulomonas fengjieae]MBO3103428.1 DUF998 domain-containing protein [Cellulomonas fengjieae]
MSATPVSSHSGTVDPAVRTTRSLLRYGVLAGPFYVIVSLAQALTREGFDLTRHAWSTLANGPLGWIQVANLLLTGVMVLAFAAGLRRALVAGPGHRWVPRLIAVYGAGLVLGGVFRADPAGGFPVGSAAPTTPTAHGTLHLLTSGVGFVALAVAMVVVARRFASQRRPLGAALSSVAAVALLGGFAMISTSPGPAGVLALTAGIVLAWAWVSAVAVDTSRSITT